MLLDNEFPPDPRVENEINTLGSAGFEIHLLCYNFRDQPGYEIINGMHIHRFKINKQVAKKLLGLILTLPFFKIIWKKQVTSLLKRINPDAIHLHDLPLCILAGYIKKNFNIPVIADMHENYPYLVSEQPYMNRFPGKMFLSKDKWFKKEQVWLDKTDHIITVAEEMKNRLGIDVVKKNKNIIVVPNTINVNLFVKVQKPDPNIRNRFKDFYNIIYIGGFDSLRGLDLLLEAMAILKNELGELRLILVGDGSNRMELQNISTVSGLNDRVYFEGLQPSSSIGSYIESAHIGIIPHVRTVQTDNSSPNKLFQYMYYKKPVISSNCTSLEKIVTETGCGLIFEDRNSSDLALQIRFLFNNRDNAIKMGEKGFDAVMNRLNWDITSRPLLDLYRKLGSIKN